MIRKNIVKAKNIILIVILLFADLILIRHSFAENNFTDDPWGDDDQIYDIKVLKTAGKISSLEDLLNKLPSHKISRILTVELKQASAHEGNHPFIYEIEYINDEGIVLEIEVNALTAQVLSKEYEH